MLCCVKRFRKAKLIDALLAHLFGTAAAGVNSFLWLALTHFQRPFLIKLPPLRAIQVFEAVARTGSVTLAAQELHISPGAVSQQVRKLEAVLELPLFERRGKGIALSQWGEVYRQELEAVFDQLHRASAALERARDEQGLVVSCLSSLASKWLGLQMFDWQQSQGTLAQARLRLVGSEREPDLRQAEADFRITYGSEVQQHGHYVQLHTDWVVPACVPDLLAGLTEPTPAQVLALPLIAIEWEKVHGSPPGWAQWAQGLQLDTRLPQPLLSFSLAGAAIDAALAGRGVVLAPAGMLDSDLASGRLVVPYEYRLQLPQAYYLAWNPGALYRPWARELYQWLQATAQAQGLRSLGPRSLFNT